MKFFKFKKSSRNIVQTVPPRRENPQLLSNIRNFNSHNEMFFSLYGSIRQAIPVIDAAICKIVRLLGEFVVECDNKDIQNELENFISSVHVNTCGHGISQFISCYLNQLITYGTAIGEIVLNEDKTNIQALYNADLKDVKLQNGSTPLDLLVCTKNKNAEFTPIKHPELVLVSALNPDPGKIYGNSVLRGLPFISDILLKIYSTIGINWERVGNVRFAITYKPSSNSSDRAYAKERASQIASEWSKAMKDTQTPSDFVAVGDVNIKVIGADNQILDSQVPVRQMLEQIISKLSIPPFLLGISWSTTETMSTQQSDMLSSELDGFRRMLDPIILKICSVWLQLNGYDSNLKIVWKSVNLKDELRIANTRLTLAKAREIEKKIEEN